MQGNLSLAHPAKQGLSAVPSRQPKPAASALLRQIESEAQAIAVSMVGFKLAYVAGCLEKSEAYISATRAGKHPSTGWFF